MTEEVKTFTGITGMKHPEFDNMFPKWEFWLDSYMAVLEDYASRYLSKNEREGTDEFAERCKRSHRENHSKHIVDLVNTYLFKEKPTRDTINSHFKKFIEDANGKGQDLSRFMRLVSLYTSILGRVYIVVDRQDPENKTGTHADNIKSKPYCYIVNPQSVKDIAFDQYGNVNWAIIEESTRDDIDPFNCTGDVSSQYRLWTKGNWYLYDEHGTEIGSGDTGLDICPIIPVDNEESQNLYHCPALISDISYLDRSIFNNYSRLDVIVNDQTFSQLIFPIEGSIAGDIIENPETRKEFLTLSTNRILFYSAGCDKRPEYISPDATQAEFILSMIKHQTKQLYASIGLENTAERSGKDSTQSGQSKSYDFDQLNKMLASKADNLKHAEEKIFEIVKKWKNIKTAKITIDYPADFDVKSLHQEIMLAQELALLEISEKFIKEIFKKVAEKALPKLDEAKLAEIMKEIDEKKPEVEEIQSSINKLNNVQNKDDNFQDKKKKGTVGGRLNQDQTKFNQT